MGGIAFLIHRGWVTEDGRSVASFNEIFDQQKIATLTTEVLNRPALFVV